MAENENTYPGFGGMMKEFEDLLILWWMDGSPKSEYKNSYQTGSFDATVDARHFPMLNFTRTYDVNYSGFLLRNKTTVEEDRLNDYCRKNGFSYTLRYWSKYVSVYMTVPDYATLKKSALMKGIHEIYQWLGQYIEWAQKFAVIPLMDEIKKYVTSHYLYNAEIYDWGISYPSTSDAEGYTSASGSFSFKQYGYRNLQSADEMVAFMLAYCARIEWQTYPSQLNLYGIRWHYYDNPDMRQGIRILPRYYAYDPLTYQAVSDKPPLKDFFD